MLPQQEMQGPGKLRHLTTGQVFERLLQGDIRFRWALIRGWLLTLRVIFRPTGQGRRHGELLHGVPHDGLQQGLHGGSGRGLHVTGEGYLLQYRHGLLQHGGCEHRGLQHFLVGTWHGVFPHGLLQTRLHIFVLHDDGRHTIILHLDDRYGLVGEHDTVHGAAHAGGRDGGGVHSSISSFLASGAPTIFRITSSKTPRRGLGLVVTLTGAGSVVDADIDKAAIHLGPWHGSLP